jgi:predicted PurR-regulated permease PerM
VGRSGSLASGGVGKALLWGGAGVLLYVGHVAFIPVALALLFALILSGPVEALHRRRVPRSLSAALILVLVLSILAGLGTMAWQPAQEWSTKVPHTMATLKQKITPIAKVMNYLDDLRKDVSTIGTQTHSSNPAPAAPVAPSVSAPALILNSGASAIASVLCFIIVTLFLLTGGPPMMSRMTAAFVNHLKSSHVASVIEKVRSEVGHFYLITTFINIGVGIITGLAMWGWGMPSPYLWGVMAAVLTYIPYAGPATTLLVITVVAAVSFDGLSRVLAVAGTYLVIATLEGQVAQPLLVGRRLQINPLLIFLALWFGGLFWGVAGIILATPTLVALKVIAKNTKNGKTMLDFLGPNDQKPRRESRLRSFARSLDSHPAEGPHAS